MTTLLALEVNTFWMSATIKIVILYLAVTMAVVITGQYIPKYKLTFLAWYNTTSSLPAEDATTHCGEYYAKEFLGNFINTDSFLQERCQTLIDNSLSVALYTVARVRLFGPAVEINTYMNVSSPTASEDIIKDCCSLIVQHLSNPAELQDQYNQHFEEGIRLISLPESGDCEEKVLEPRSFKLVDQGPICELQGWYFDKDHWRCSSRPLITPKVESTTLEVRSTTATSVSSDVVTSPSIEEPSWIKIIIGSDGISVSEGEAPSTLEFSVNINYTSVCENGCNISVKMKLDMDDKPRCLSDGSVVPQVLLMHPYWSHQPTCSLLVMPDPEYRYSLQVVAALDAKYDGSQKRQLELILQSQHFTEIYTMNVAIEDNDHRSTCKSINDPHIVTFDGLPYDNFYEGEFVLYEHMTLPFKVHAIFQRCSMNTPATCNCAVAVQSGDDVIVIERCFRDIVHFNRLQGEVRDLTKTQLYIHNNGDFTAGTRIYEASEGRKYVITLPHGGFVKVMASGQQLNLWIVGSPHDWEKTRGLCGTCDGHIQNDLLLSNGTLLPIPQTASVWHRLQPRDFSLSWRVEQVNSLFDGVEPAGQTYTTPVYCDCSVEPPYCAPAAHVINCDTVTGKDITEILLMRAITDGKRRKREIIDNTLNAMSDNQPIRIDKKFVPPEQYNWKNDWDFTHAQDFCYSYIKYQYKLGQLCSEISAVNFDEDVAACLEDIKITGNASWADASRDSMKEQCLEEIQRNTSLPLDMVKNIKNAMCFNDCSGHRGKCVNGQCVCDSGWTSSDCSLAQDQVPYALEMPHYGLCDLRYMRCKSVIVYGDQFIDSPKLTCFFQECDVGEHPHNFHATDNIIHQRAIFINIGAVECPVPELRNYLVRVSNNGVFDNSTDPLLFIPFNSLCNECSTNTTTCARRRNSCIIDGQCFGQGDSSPSDQCLICQPHANDLEWTTKKDCKSDWWHGQSQSIPIWLVGLAAALFGSVVIVLCALMVYRCCANKRKKPPHQSSEGPTDLTEEQAPFHSAAALHRHRFTQPYKDNLLDGDADDLPVSSPLSQPQRHTDRVYLDGRGVENGVDSSTYF